jgi:hypothetical protein
VTEKPLTSLQEFLFNAPLYAPYKANGDFNIEEEFLVLPVAIDGHCPFCGRQSVFGGTPRPITQSQWHQYLEGAAMVVARELTCSRNKAHVVTFWVKCSNHIFIKVGQDPSLADIANDASKAYRGLLSKEDSGELHKAIGLAAHGVGIGSFVYLRRIFERLIKVRFDTFKVAEGWTEDQFKPKRMQEKIELLKDHLPGFLVENRKIYSILSL